jgi:putative membrane protein
MEQTDSKFELVAKGFIIGTVDIVAGVSGGTMAIIVGLYERILDALSKFDFTAFKLFIRGKWRELFAYIPVPFLAFVTSGVVLAILVCSKIVTIARGTYPLYTQALLFGLMLASAYLVYTHIQVKNLRTVALICIGLGLGWGMAGIIPATLPQNPPVLFASGVIAAMAAMLPGLSGAFTLQILGQYYPVLQAINEWNFLVLIPFGAGLAVGILLFVRLVAWLLKHYHDITIALLLGLMLGSIRKIWPWGGTPPTGNPETGIALFWMIIGFVLVFGVQYWVSKKAKIQQK